MRPHVIAIRLSDEEYASLNTLAQSLDRSASWVVRDRLFNTGSTSTRGSFSSPPTMPPAIVASTGQEVSQMSHLSVDPTHRPLAEPLDQRVESGSSVSPTADRAAASTPSVPKTAQQRRDEILHGVTTPPRTKR